ncbi:MAG: tetratricopeptide repeat protein [Flavobacteriaceae bacterium]|nr:tetratricopeptide repeat protein [Flavobacteriaceae bacterium]
MPKLLLLLCVPLILTAQETNFEKAVALYEAKQYQVAKPLFESYLNESPNDLKTVEYLGDIAAFALDWDKSIDYYKILVKKYPDNASFNFKLGGALGRKAQSTNRFRAAMLIGDIKKHLEKAAELDPNHKEVRWALVDLYSLLPSFIGGSETTASKYANQLLGISELEGNIALANIAEHFKKPQLAEKHFKIALKIYGSGLKIHPHNSINYHLGKISGEYNIQLQNGLKYLDAYIKNHTIRDGIELKWAYFRKAQIYRHLGDKNQAQNWIAKALASNEDFKEAHLEKEQISRL